jgi:DNA-binding response OmpR family regulator
MERQMIKRVLVVDDSRIVLEKALEVLSSRGYEVSTAISADAADAIIYSGARPDIIILDVMMPMLDGDKKARILKEDDSTKEIPILLMSSKPEDELVALAIESGSDGYIRKPFTSDEIVLKIEAAFDP